MDDVVLKIGGFNILVKFNKVEFIQKVKMPDYIRWRYKDFIAILRKSLEIDYVITFKYVNYTRSLTSPKGEHMFINLYDQTSSKSLTTFYHISLFQFDVILTHVLQKMLARNEGFIVHTSAISVSNKAQCFMGKSGAGKSTIVKLLSTRYKPLADDSGIIRMENDQYFFYQMPLIDKNEKIQKSSHPVPLGGIHFLKKGQDSEVRIIKDTEEIIKKLSLQLYSDQGDIRKQLSYMAKFINSQCSFSTLTFSMDHKKLLEVLEVYETKV